MRSKIFALSVCIVFFSTFLFAQGAANITVEEIEICSSVENRQPIGISSSFSADVGTVCCFTRLSSDQDTTSIHHVWYYNDKEMADIELQIKAKTWRTWSSKKILNSWTGTWRVDILSPGGEVLATKEFNIE
jgi:hypothetical protein